VEVSSVSVSDYMLKRSKVIEVHDGFPDVTWSLKFGRKYVYLYRGELLVDGSTEIELVGKWER